MVLPPKAPGIAFPQGPRRLLRIAGLLSEHVAPQVLEVGPGTGALTQPLSNGSETPRMVEIDAESVAYLPRGGLDFVQTHPCADLL